MTCINYHNVCYYVNYEHVQPLQIAQTDLLQGSSFKVVTSWLWRLDCDELTCDKLTTGIFYGRDELTVTSWLISDLGRFWLVTSWPCDELTVSQKVTIFLATIINLQTVTKSNPNFVLLSCTKPELYRKCSAVALAVCVVVETGTFISECVKLVGITVP